MLRPGVATGPSRARSPRTPSPRSRTAASPATPSSLANKPKEKKLLEEYAVGATLGEGAFGVVRVCQHRKTRKEFAVKMVDKVETPVPAILREAEMLKEMAHPNIVRFVDIFIERCFVCIVMDIYKGGDLVDGLQRQGPFESDKIVHIAYQLSSAIHHLHEHSVAHRDIKGDNCMMDREDMLDAQCRVVLTDFGAASTFDPAEPFSSQVGTRQFWSPELLDKRYGLGADVWAFGVLMYGLVTGRFPFRDESDIRKKEVKIRTKVDPACKEYILSMLHKDPALRITSKAIMAHPFLRSVAGMASPTVSEPTANGDGAQEHGIQQKQMIREDGANVGIKDRRHELVERLHQEHEGKHVHTVRKVAMLDFKPFTVESKSRPGVKLGYEWWDRARLKSSGLLEVLASAKPTPLDVARNTSDLTMFSQMLQEHGIDASKFGQGSTKSLQDLAAEVRKGNARLMLDATAHKKLVRVVNIVVVRLRADQKDRFVVEAAIDCETRGKYDTLRLPAKIKPPHENTHRCAERVLHTLGLDISVVTLKTDKVEICEEEYESPSYPGVTTIYRKEIVEGVLNTADLSTEQAGSVGLPGFKNWSLKEDKQLRFYQWMSEEDSIVNRVQFYTSSGGQVVSSLVNAPIGMNVDALQERLVAAKIDVTKYGQDGTRTLKDFSQELCRGAAFLSQDGSALVRTVNVVLVILADSKGDRTLVQTHTVDADGVRHDNARLPGNKCRPDENTFNCARNTFRREVELDDDSVVFDEVVTFVEEKKDSSSYPGMTTVYRKYLVMATF